MQSTANSLKIVPLYFQAIMISFKIGRQKLSSLNCAGLRPPNVRKAMKAAENLKTSELRRNLKPLEKNHIFQAYQAEKGSVGMRQKGFSD